MKNSYTLLLIGFLIYALAPQSLLAQDCIEPDQIDTGIPCNADPYPVCGCDGVTYVNACQAENWYGITEWTPGSCTSPDACVADFMFVYLDNGEVLLYNNSVNFTGHEWNIEGQNLTSDANGLLHIIPATSPTLVCLNVWNDTGCTHDYCVSVYPGAPEEMCNISDCVWPGDVNGNWFPNNYDLLNIGLGFHAEGPPRPFFPFPDDPIHWAPNYSDLWAGTTGGHNQKHLDCDGNGIVNEDDIAAIYYNYVPDNNTPTTPVEGAPQLWVDFGVELIIVDLNSPPQMELTATLMMGNADNIVTDLHGLAFKINFPDSLVYPGTTTFNYIDNSFFGYNFQVLSVSRDLADFTPGIFDVGLSRKAGQGVSGYGAIAEIQFIVNSDIIGGRAIPETPFDVVLDHITLIDSNGDPIEYGLAAEPARVIFLNTGISGTSDTPFDQQLTIFPNPVQDMLTIESQQTPLHSICLINHLGQKVMRQQVQGTNIQVSTAGLTPGIYLLEAFGEQDRVIRKVVIE
ncbi:MAG: hypothetical protein DHS20C18_05450 [Saprospiraceae bacterium]|nr:MAG: hypothetical protein DHS20C18_05450 [Saprospiraceae bacterium]